MVINFSKYNWILILILSSSELFSKETNLFLLLFILLYYVLVRGGRLPISIPGAKYYFTLLIVGLFIGIVNVIINENTVFNFVKHFIYYLLPLFFWQFGYILSNKENLSCKPKNIKESIVITAFLLSSYDLIGSIISFLSRTKEIVDLYSLRSEFGRGFYVPIIALYLVLFYSREIKLSKNFKRFLVLLFTISILIHFSRTHFIILLILVFFSGFEKNMKNIKKIIFAGTLILAGVGVLYLYFPNLVIDFYNKTSQSMTEITFSKSSWSHKDIIWNWRGYEMYSALNHFKSSSFFEQILGGGFGTVLYMGEYAYLVSDLPYLLFLHNGYFTTLLVFGVSGVILFVLWVLSLFGYSKYINNTQDSNFIKGLAVVILFTTYFVNGPLFSVSQATFLLYFALFSNNHGELDEDFKKN
ncbi:hypothetical protein MASAN616_03230 [Streptococcus sp. SN-1]|uniref:O-antigen ligase-related domain-containing protein n=1 Tax=Streptococcus sp. SN-1 TaxID=3074854 RepID=A0AAT9FZ36_9STRE